MSGLSQAREMLSTAISVEAFERLGGQNTFFGRQHAFESLLADEHSLNGKADASLGMYRFKGMEQYGNVVGSEEVELAARKFVLDLGYSRDHLAELSRWYLSRLSVGSIDAYTLGLILASVKITEPGGQG